jgi:hypothetical protein
MRLRLVTALVYALIAAAGIATIASQLQMSWSALTEPFSYLPDLTLPWMWLALGFALAAGVMDAVRRMASGTRVGLVRYVAILLGVAAAFTARKYVRPPGHPEVEDGVAHLVARVELAANESYDHEKRYSADIRGLTATWPDDLRDLGFFRRGAEPLRSRLHVVSDTWGPALAPPAGIRPGDVVLALSRDGQSYWITSFTLDRSGRIAPLVDARGRAIVASAANGRAASRLDPLFPEYPHKSDMATPPL